MTAEFASVGSFECDDLVAISPDSDGIVIAMADRVAVVRGSERDEFTHGRRIDDVAAADRVFVLSGETLAAYTRDGDRVWETDAKDAHAVAAYPGTDVVGTLGRHRIRGLDADTGREQFRTDRPRDGDATDDRLLATSDGFVVTTWSFLTGVTLEGETLFDRNVNSAIRDVGASGPTLTVAVQSGRIVGIDAATGDVVWRAETEVKQVSPVGDDRLLVNTGDSVRAVDPADGGTTPVPGVGRGDVYATTGGSIVCSVRAGTVATYVRSDDELDAVVGSESVGVGGTLDVRLRNPTDRTVRTTVSADVEGTSLSPASRSVAVDPGESTWIDFPVARVGRQGEQPVRIRIDDRSIARSEVVVEDAADTDLSVDISLSVESIDGAIATLDVAVANQGGSPLGPVGLLETEDVGVTLDPGETWSTTITRPYEPGRRVSVGIEAHRNDRRREFAPTCTLPDRPTVEVDTREDFINVRVDAPEDVSFTDEFVIEMPGANRARTGVTIEDGELLLLIPVVEPGVVRVALTDLDIDERVRVGDDPAAGGTARRRTRHLGDSSSQRSGSRSSGSHERSPGIDADRNRDRKPSGTELSSDPDGSAPDTGTTAGDGVEAPDRRTGESANDESVSDTASAAISVRRSLDGTPPTLGRRFTERLSITNRGAPTTAVLVSDGRRRELGSLDGTVDLQRSVAVFDDETTLPEASLEVAGSVVDGIEARRISARPDADVTVRASVDPGAEALLADVENAGDRPCRIRRIELAGTSIPLEDETTVAPGRSETARISLRRCPVDAEATAAELSVTLAREGGTETTVDTLAAVRPSDTASDTDDCALRYELDDATTVAGEDGTVVLVVENAVDEPLHDVVVSASGDPIYEYLYSEAHREILPPGARIEHYVDLDATPETVAFDLSMSYERDGTAHDHAFRASGPSVERGSEWSDAHRAAWTVDPTDEGDGAGVDLPSVLSTPYRSRSGGQR